MILKRLILNRIDEGVNAVVNLIELAYWVYEVKIMLIEMKQISIYTFNIYLSLKILAIENIVWLGFIGSKVKGLPIVPCLLCQWALWLISII